jgi:hypothetical protein
MKPWIANVLFLDIFLVTITSWCSESRTVGLSYDSFLSSAGSTVHTTLMKRMNTMHTFLSSTSLRFHLLQKRQKTKKLCKIMSLKKKEQNCWKPMSDKLFPTLTPLLTCSNSAHEKKRKLSEQTKRFNSFSCALSAGTWILGEELTDFFLSNTSISNTT